MNKLKVLLPVVLALSFGFLKNFTGIFHLLHWMCGSLLTCWYVCLRWNIIDPTKHKWVLSPINLLTAFSAIFFLIGTVFLPKFVASNYIIQNIFMLLAIFFLLRNVYYMFTDYVDYIDEKQVPLYYLVLDFMAVYYTLFWIISHRGLL